MNEIITTKSKEQIEKKPRYIDMLLTVPPLVDDAYRALRANAYFSALCISLALVDECANVEWRKKYNCARKFNETEKSFIQWYGMWNDKEFIKKVRHDENGVAPYLNGQLLYKIRCCLLHGMSSNIDFANCGLSDDANRNITQFSFVVNEYSEWGFGGSITSHNKSKQNTMAVDVAGLAKELLYFVTQYYERNKDTSDFNTIAINDFTSIYATCAKEKGD